MTYVEVIDTNRCKLEDIEGVLGKLDSGELHLGGKTTRGMGEVSVVSCLRRCFGHEDVDAWLDFDQFDDEESASWSCSDNITDEIHKAGHNNSVELRLILKLRGGISIREYSTKPGDKDNPEPDYGQMIAHGIKDDKGEDIPVIPGTSWAGAFRERFERFAGPRATKNLFGYVETKSGGEEENSFSCITFSESKILGGEWKQVTRNAIDRFTGGTMSGALYTERTYFCGTTELMIRIQKSERFDAESFKPLVAVLADLHNGFMSVGGLASVGRGLFRITSAKLTVNGVENEGFSSAMAGDNGFTEELIAPNLENAAKLFVRREGE